jgi:AcrR family transcriptional regulator
MVSERLSKEQRRGKLLDAARRIFGKKGYRATEVNELAADAGVTRPILYRHFPGGKREVFSTILQEHIDELMRSLYEAMGSASKARERIHRGLLAYLAFAEERPEGFRLLTAISDDDDDDGVGLADYRDQLVGAIESTIASVMKDADLDPDGAAVYAHTLLGGVESVVAWWLKTKTMDRDELANHLLAFTWRGFDGLPKQPGRFGFKV